MNRNFAAGRIVALLALCVCLGAGCVFSPLTPETVLPESAQPVSPAIERADIGPGMEVLRASSSLTGTLLLFGFDQERYRFSFVATSSRVVMREWMRAFPEAVAGINGTYFHEDLTPSGFFVGEGPVQRERVFDQALSALILTGKERLRLVDTSKEKVTLPTVIQGAQTYPILIKDGKVSLTRDTGKIARRSWIGVDEAGDVWLGVLVDGQMSLYDLAQRLEELPIQWKEVVNLDGGPSTGVFVRGDEDEGVRETMGGVPNVLLVERK